MKVYAGSATVDLDGVVTRGTGTGPVVVYAEGATVEVRDVEQPQPDPGDQPPQYLIWDGGSGPTRSHWSDHLSLAWKHKNVGDWIDADGVPQGPRPFSLIQPKVAGPFDIDATALVQRWATTGENKGVHLHLVQVTSLSSYAQIAGRLSATPPLLIVEYGDGSQREFKGMSAGWNVTSVLGMNTQTSFRLSPNSTALVQFAGAEFNDCVRATIRLQLTVVRYAPKIEVNEIDAPRIIVGAGSRPVEQGLAASGEAALAQNPACIFAGDFSDTSKFGSFRPNPEWNDYQLVPDPDAPGTVMFRGSMLPHPTDNGVACAGVTVTAPKRGYGQPDRTDPMLPLIGPVHKELYSRCYFSLLRPWNSRRAGKMAIAIDLRWGWYNVASGGYWQETTGNGGSPGDGRKVRYWNKIAGKYQWMYRGHMLRMECGVEPNDYGNPYVDLRPVEAYCYHNDQTNLYGELMRMGNSLVRKGQRACVEYHIKANTISGPFDTDGNGVANPDGVLEFWIDGAKVFERTNMRFFCHPDMGVENGVLSVMTGGKHPAEVPLHYTLNHFATATQYIGPYVGV